MSDRHLQSAYVYKSEFYVFIYVPCSVALLMFSPSHPGRNLQARQNLQVNFCLGSQERFGDEQNQIPEFPHAFPTMDSVDKTAATEENEQ
jgi:hypothetical protein